MKIELPANGWNCRPYQVPAWNALVNHGVKRLCLVWHRRAGKDDMALHATAVMAHQRVGNYWHMLPKGEQARKAIWDAVNPHTGKRRIDEAFPPELRELTRNNDMMIRFKNGSSWQVIGSDNHEHLVGSPPVGIVFSEWSLADPEAWAYIRPILAENDGWAMFIYTPRGPNHGLTTYQNAISSPGWFAQTLTVEDTGILTPEQIKLEREEYIKEYGKEAGEAFFLQEWYVSFEAAVIGAIYGKEISRARDEGRITRLAFDPYRPVGTMWDLGWSDDTAIWFFQQVGDQIRFIDYYAASNAPLDHYVEILRDRQKRLGYKYDENAMIFPHDVEVHDISSGKSRRTILWDLGVPVTTSPKMNLWDAINIVRRNFHRFWFDVESCEKGLEALSLYQREWDDKKKMFSPKPKHDWTSHAADALRTGVVVIEGRVSSGSTLLPKGKKDVYSRAFDRMSEIEEEPPSPWSA